MLQIYYSDHFVLPLPQGHRFPMQKYKMLRNEVVTLKDVHLEEAPLASIDDLLLVHDRSYIERVIHGQLNASEQREIGFPWSEQMVIRSRRSAGATIAACMAARINGVAVNLAGGTHHAYADKGSGFCVFNDAAIAAKKIQQEFSLQRNHISPVLIIDLDVHQGNGTAAILQDDESVFTFSMHGEKNFPFRKESSDLDIGLADGCEDAEYLAALERGLQIIANQIQPELVIYLAGADPYHGDRLGRLNLSQDGLGLRDEAVLQWCFTRKIPVAIAMAGGYGNPIEETVAIHAQTIRKAIAYQW
jgi:acetoin utilization deacetylase AcuC-like enzyme